MTRRGTAEHVAAATEQWIGSVSFKAWKEQNIEAIHRNIRRCNLADPEACRATVQAAQSFFAMMASLESLARSEARGSAPMKVVRDG